MAAEVVQRDAITPFLVFGDGGGQRRRLGEAVVGQFEHHPVGRQSAARQYALEYLPVPVGHRADEPRVDVKRQDAAGLPALQQEVQRVEGAHQAVEPHQCLVGARIEEDRLRGQCPSAAPGLQMGFMAEHPAAEFRQRLEQAAEDVAGEAGIYALAIEFEGVLLGAGEGELPALVEVMHQFGQGHGGLQGLRGAELGRSGPSP